MAQIGADCVLYRNTGTWSVPVWNEIPIVRDLTLTLEKGEADVSNRGTGGWRAVLGTLKDGNLEFEVVWERDDDDFEAIRDAFLANTLLDLVALDGPISVTGTQGLRAEMSIMTFSRNEALEDAVTASVTARPGSATNAPWWAVSNGTALGS